jgi:hypothetical protein
MEFQILMAVSMKMTVFWVVDRAVSLKQTNISEVVTAFIIIALMTEAVSTTEMSFLQDYTLQQPRRQSP